MHCMATIRSKSLSRIREIVHSLCEDGTWDYATIGGRFNGLIPVSKNAKCQYEVYHNIGDFADLQGRNFPELADTQYTCVARIRNIDFAVAHVMREELGILDFDDPCTIIIDREDYFTMRDQDSTPHDEWISLRNELTRCSGGNYIAVVDYHI